MGLAAVLGVLQGQRPRHVVALRWKVVMFVVGAGQVTYHRIRYARNLF